MRNNDGKTPQGLVDQSRALKGVERTRSPQYPQISLPEALSHIRLIYNGLHTSRASERRIIELLGFKGKSGTTQAILSALKKYGLLEGRKDSFSVSRQAV